MRLNAQSLAATAFTLTLVFSCHPLGLDINGSRNPKSSENRVSRNKYQQPFAVTSIWNMPLGSAAKYVPADIPAHQYTGTEADVIVLTPDAPIAKVYTNQVGWTQGNRCAAETNAGFTVPVPRDFLVPDERPSTPNSSAAFLLTDGRTLAQFQPVARCQNDGPVTFTAGARFADVDIYGDGIEGAHGGSGLSSIGGTIRLGELIKGAPPMRHALKVNLNAATSISPNQGGYRWPAKNADSCAPNCYNGQNSALRMGALLALKQEFSETKLETEPAKQLTWTLKNYGAYVVDNSAWSCYYFAFERSPSGSAAREFAKSWGYTPSGLPYESWTGTDGRMESVPNMETPWGRDMIKIFSALHIVDNNTPETPGGGGTPLQPLAPNIDEP